MNDEKKPQKWYFGSMKTTLRHLGELINEYRADEEADTGRFRALVYALRSVIEGQKAVKELAIEERLDQIEDVLRERKP